VQLIGHKKVARIPLLNESLLPLRLFNPKMSQFEGDKVRDEVNEVNIVNKVRDEGDKVRKVIY